MQRISYFLIGLLVPSQVHAQGVYEENVAGIDWILVLIQNVLAVALRLVGVTAFIMLIVGSYKILTSSGNPDNLDSGKKTFSMAIGGLIIATLAWLAFDAIATITGVESIKFISIPTLQTP